MGTVLVSQEEAIELGENDEPNGFIAGESEGVWQREPRTAEELDAELEMYAESAALSPISTP